MYTGSFLDTPIDYYGNWVFDVNKHYWTTDIAIDGITPNIDIVLNIASVTDGIQYCDAEVISAGIRLYAYMPPIEDTVCLVGFKTGTGNTVINCRNTVDSDVFIAEYNTTTRDEIKTAYENGKALFCKVGYYIVPFSQVTGRNRNIYIFGPTQDGNQFKCNAAGWSEGKWDGRELPSVTASDDGKFLRVVDGAWAKAEATSDSKVGDIKVTTRTDLGDAWALCNGAAVPSNATELSALIPQNEYPLSTFDVLNLASTSEVYDIYNAADGNLYVISTRYNSDNQQRQYLSQISPSEGVLREIELTSIVAASSVFVDDSKIYLFGMPVTKKTESFPIVAYGDFSGGDFPTGWSTVEIQFPTNTYLPLNTYSVGSMGREGIFRIVGGKYYYMVYCYNSGKNGFAQPFMVSDTLGGQCTILTTGSLNAATLFVDSEDYVYLAGNSGSTLRLEVIKDGVVIKTGLTRSVYELSGCVWFIVSGNITYCYAYSPGSAVLLSLTYEKNSSSDMVVRSQSGTRSTPIIQWGDKVYSYNTASNSKYDLYQLTDLPLGTFTTTNQSATTANLPALLSGMATREGDYYISLQPSGVTNGSVLKLIVPKSLPTITFDSAYAYIKVKE